MQHPYKRSLQGGKPALHAADFFRRETSFSSRIATVTNKPWERLFRMEKFRSALDMVTALKPDKPVFAARPHAAGRADFVLTKRKNMMTYDYGKKQQFFFHGLIFFIVP